MSQLPSDDAHTSEARDESSRVESHAMLGAMQPTDEPASNAKASFEDHATVEAPAHPPIDAATSDISRCPFFRALSAATSAFAARQASATSVEVTEIEPSPKPPRANTMAPSSKSTQG